MIGKIILALVVTFGATRAQTGCDQKADVTFLLDSSDNVGKDNFQKQLNFIRDVSNNFQIGPNKVQVSAVTFGTGATNQFYLNQYNDKMGLQNAISNIQFKGGQAKMANAIRYATGTSFSPIHGGRADAPHVAVVLTNEPSGTIDTVKLESQTARDNGVILYTVGIGGAVDPNELVAIASDPDSRHMFTAQNFDALGSLSDLLATKICNELPPDPNMLQAPTGCLKKADLVFMVDSSTSVGSTNFQKLEHFLKDVISKIDVGPNNVQVGLVKYGSYPSMELSLGQYQTRPEVMKAVESMTYIGGGTNDGDAISFTGRQVFSQYNGARGNVPRIGVIITDGGSSNPAAAVAAANKARTENIGLIAVGVGNAVSRTELSNIADKPSSSNVFTVNSYDNLDTITNNLIQQMCTIQTSQPSIVTSAPGATLPPDPCQDKLPNCDQYGSNVCTDYQQWAQANCARTCSICTPLYTVAPPKCEDTFPNCASYGRDACTQTGSFVQTNCQLFCGLCGNNTSPTGYYGKCSYKGKDYKTGEKWYDGCDYECICEDGNSGRYRCTNRCPVYHDLPSDCTLVSQPGECCLQPVCNFNPTVNSQISSGHGVSPSGIDVCIFKGKQYFQDQFWRDGCDYQCQCTDAKKGVFKCDDLCPTYNSIPPYCHLEKKAGECCSKPVCEFDSQVGSFGGYGSISGNGVGATPTAHPPCLDALPTCNMYSKSVCTGTYRGWAAINCRKYCDMCPDGLPKPGPDDRCIFNGQLYRQGERWNTSCSTTCTCENSIYGYYRCVDSCPTYNNIPNDCVTIKQAGACCPVLRCNNGFFLSSSTNPVTIGNGATFSVVNPPPGMTQVKPTLPTGELLPPGAGTSGFTAPSLSGCLYKGQIYYQDQAWEDGCQYTCICKDAGTGLYACKEKCPSYPVLPPSCHMVTDNNDVCCKSPKCTTDPVTHLIPVPIPVFKPSTQIYGSVVPPTLSELHQGIYTKTVTLVPTGFTPAPPTIGSNIGTGGIGFCTYRGQTYTQGQVWEDGCDFNCVCDDATRGHYQCTEKCVHYNNLPEQCYLIKDPVNPCCDIPKCNFAVNYITHIGEVKTTTPRPLGEYCVYEGQRYQQGQTWYDGCSYKCTCEDAAENVYRCLSRCPEYENVDQNCQFVSDPKDPSCCVMPQCPEKPGPTNNPITVPTAAPSGTYTGQGTGTGYCEYKSVHYSQGQKWQDGCDLSCTCTDAETGFYRCSEACPRYVNIPEYCTLITDFANPCCKKPRCNFPAATGAVSGTAAPTTTLAPTPPKPGQTPSPNVGPTPAPHYRYCLYKNVQYFQGETWEDGCQYKCRCDNADKGLYTCSERCATYDNVPETCTFVTDPEDTCCLVPSCPPATTPKPVPGAPTPAPSPYQIPTAAPGSITGSANVPTLKPGMTPAPINYCEYKGQQYSQGQKWDDGCDFTCECIDARTGKYKCLEKCTKYVGLPSNCRLIRDAANPCCRIPECTGEPTPAPPGTKAPSIVTQPPKNVCVYKGVSYTQGQTWYDGCDYVCVCENEMTGLYTCNDRCPAYGQLPSQCTLVPSSTDPLCCKEPKCIFQNTKNQTSGYLTPPTPPPGVIHGGAATPTPIPSLAPSPGYTPTQGPTPSPKPPVCVYKGNEYQQGQRWSDGCDYNCVCEDAMTGRYECTEMCAKYDDLPAGCRLVSDPFNPCCKKAYCPAKNVPTPAPPGVATPSPQPKTGCMYNGVMFGKGEQWNDGCDLQCICEDEMSGFYRCRDRCSKYDLAEGCTYVTDPRDACCKVPYCSPVQPTPAPWVPGMVPTPQPGFTYAPDKIPTPAPGRTYAPGQFPTWVPGMIPTPAPGFTYAPEKIPTPAPGRTYAPGMFPTYVPGMVPTPAPGFTYAPDKIPTPAPGRTYAPGKFPTWVPGMIPTPAPGFTYAPNKIPTPAVGQTYAPGMFPTYVPGMVPTPAPGYTFAPEKIPTPAPGYTYAPGQFPTYVPGMVPTPAPGFTYAPGKIPTPAPGRTYAPGKFPTWVPGMIPTPAPGVTYAPNKIPTPAPGQTYAPGMFPTYVPGMVPTPAPGFTYAPDKIPTPAPFQTYAPGMFPTYVPGMVPTPAPGFTYAPDKIPTPAPGQTYAPGKFPTYLPGMVPTPAPGYTYPPYLIPTPAPGQTYAPGKFPVFTQKPYPTPGPGLTYPTLKPGQVPTPAPGQTYAPYLIPTPAPGQTYAPGKFPTYVPGMVPTPAPGKTIPPWLIPGITPAPGSTYAPFHYPTWVPGMIPTPAPGVTYAPDKIPTPAPGKTYAPWNFPTYVPGMVPTPQPGYTYAPDKIPTPAPGRTYAPGQFPTWVPGMIPTPAPGFTYAPSKIPTPAPGQTYAPGLFPTYVPGMVPTPAPGFTYAPDKIPTPAPGFTYAPGQFPTYVPGMVPTPAPGFTYAPDKIPTPGPGLTYAPGMFPTYVPGMVPTPAPGFTYAPGKIPTPAPGKTYAPGNFPTWVPGMVPTPAPGFTYAPDKIPTPAPGFTYAPGMFPTWVPGMVPTPAPGYTFAPDKIPTPAPGFTYPAGQFPTWVPGMVPTPAPDRTYAPSMIPTPGPGLTYAPGQFPTPSPAPTPYPVPTAIPGIFQGIGVNHNTNASGCVHYGVIYKQGQIWQDGCKYDCECLDEHTGRYQCKERCPLFLNLPSYCRLVVNPNDACCKVPVCVTPAPQTPAPQPQPTPGPGPNPTPGPGVSPTPNPNPNPNPQPTPGPNPQPTPQPKQVCVMNGQQYVAGQTWYNGCDQRCVCEDGTTGFYRCYDRCAKFPNVPSSCTMVPDPQDPTCCKVPQCIPVPRPGQTVPTDKPFTVTGVPGVISGNGVPPTPGTGGITAGPRNACVYNGRIYTQGQKWQDGCKYDCICTDGMTGKYECTERCAAFPFVPPQCQMRRDPNDICCFRPICDYNQTVPTPAPFPGPSPSPGQITINPPLPPSYCVYKGVPYSQGQTWDDGCTKKCRCDDADMNIYTCFDRCKSYNVGPGCVMVSDPQDSCCQVPKCTVVPPTAGPTVCPYPMPTAVPGVITGGPQPDPVTGVAPSNVGFCEYKGVQYKEGQSWDDGCSYTCSCIDANSGQYQCQEKCPRYVGLPSYCKMAQDPSSKCCTKPACDVCPSTPVPGVFTPTPGPSQSPTPAPKKDVCIMNGKQYSQGQKWYVGCDKICVCDDGKTGAYSCTQRCPAYQNTAGCTLVPDPRDPVCCQAPSCPGNTGVFGTVNGTGTAPPPTLPPDVTGHGIPPSTQAPPKVCVYKGKYYTQGQKWQDGCAFDCECVDAMSGNFKCVDRCPRYPNLPSTCTLVYDPSNPCCQKPQCQAATPSPAPGQTPAPNPNPTPPTDFCVYQGVAFKQGQTFNQGCDKICICENAMTGKITCNDRCQTFPPLSSNCSLVTDPDDQCCQIPSCFNPNTQTQTGVQGTFTGSNLPNTNNPYPQTGSRNVCVYKGQTYNQGQVWDDGCSYTCECLDASKGLYKCTDKCQKFPAMPSYCRMVQDPNDKCCQTPLCNPPTQTTPGPTGQPTPAPNACVYKGSIYQQGQQWYDGCDFICRCENASANFYSCQQRCAAYTQKTGCTVVPDPKDPTCCEIPSCPLTPPSQGPTPAPGILNPNPSGVINGFGPTPAPGSTLPPGYRQGCVYKGMVFHTGDKFDDGCDYECECLDDMTGKYRCVEKCQTYPNMPTYCTLVQDTNKPCCKVPYCDYRPNPVLPTPGPQIVPTPRPGVVTVAPYVTPNPPFVNPTPQPSVTPSPTTKPTGFCVYKGVYYTQGQMWNDGCNLRCRCEDVQSGYYTCNQRCPTYPASTCPLRADPSDSCCLVPDCNTGKIPTPIPTPGPGQSTVNPTMTPKPITGTFSGTSGSKVPYLPGSGNVGGRSACIYKSKIYTQGQKWQDGCSYNCECIDASRGKYSCTDRCGKYPYLPPYCHYEQSKTDACCREPVCNIYIQPTTVAPPTQTTQLVTVPPPDNCIYTNGMQYPKGATWSTSCSVTCTCQDPATNNFQCSDRCPVYSSLPAICTLVTDPSDQCCMKPQCTLPTGVTMTPIIGNGPTGSATPPTSLQVIPLGTHTVFTGYGKPKPGQIVGSGGRCVYKSVIYSQGQSWDDGCDFVCTCENQQTGMYRCWNKCPTYPSLPSYCKSVTVPGQCCKSITCDIPGYGTYNPVPQLVPTPLPPTSQPGGTTPNPYIILPNPNTAVIGKYPGGGYYLPNATNPNVIGSIRDKCVYKSRLYNQGETWEDGCDFSCECLDQRTGYFECKPLCPVYNNLPSNQCYLVTAYGQCCSQPMCYDPDKGTAVNPLTSGKFPVVGTYNNGFSGFRPGYSLPGTVTTSGTRSGCVYKGKVYQKGDKWDDGCDFTCSCLDDSNGLYQCAQKCPSYTKIPPLCTLETQPGTCCKRISCKPSNGGTLPPNYSTIVPTTAQPVFDKDCYDRIDNCRDYGQQACGQQYDAWARRNCNLTCGFCHTKYSTTPPPCIDKLPDCPSYQKSSCSGIYEPWAKDNCRKYCGFCLTTAPVTVPQSMTTVPPGGNCKDNIDTCSLLDLTYYCSGSFYDWAIQNCQKTCGLCGSTTVVTTPVPTTPSPSSWLLFMKGVAGAPGPDLYQLWHSPQTLNQQVPAASRLTNEYNGHYKPDYSNHWKDYCIDMVKVAIYNNGVEKAFIIFNATGADKNSWFTNDRIITSSWTDIKSASKDVMSMSGSATLGREFYISGHTSATDQCDAFGWMMISTKTGCPFEAPDQKPTFYYAPGTSQAHWGFTNPLTGDVFAIQAHPTCFQPTTKPHTTQAPVCDYKGKKYTQGQFWQDGCMYNCTCEDASIGFYKCTDLCPKYTSLPAGCSLITKPGECCAQPDCPLNSVVTKKPLVITGATSACFYKGVYYSQDQTWNDGCSQSCTCTDASLGLYSCRGLCLNWNQLPAECHLDDAPPGLCCKQPKCPSNIIVTVPKGFESQYPGYPVDSSHG